MREPQEIEDEEHEQVLARVAAIDLVEPASNGRRACGIPAQRRTLARPGVPSRMVSLQHEAEVQCRRAPADQGADEHWDQAEQATETGWR